LIADTLTRFGAVLLLDCHSMPSAAHPADGGKRSPIDFVLGDNHGISCAPELVRAVARWLRERGYRVAHNQPYAGGFTTQTYGSPTRGVHTLQIEICRALYMDELRVLHAAGFAGLQSLMADLISMVGEFAAEHLEQRLPRAAE